MTGAGELNTYCDTDLILKLSTGIDYANWIAGVVFVFICIPVSCAAMCVNCCCLTVENSTTIYPVVEQQMVYLQGPAPYASAQGVTPYANAQGQPIYAYVQGTDPNVTNNTYQ